MSDAFAESREWLIGPSHVVWLDQDILTGDGLIEEIAPDNFVLWDDGLERVRFGKLIGITGGPEQTLPIVPELLPKVVEAAEEHPGECVFIEEIGNRAPVDMWLDFFKSAINDAQNIIAQPVLFDEVRKSEVEYAASIIDPRPEVRHRNLRKSRYDDFDVLTFMGNPNSVDYSGRIATSEGIRMHFAERHRMTHAEMNTLGNIRSRALGYIGVSS